MIAIKNAIKRIKSEFSNFSTSKKILFISVVVLIVLYCFVMWSFSSRRPWNYVEIGLAAILSTLLIVHCFLENKFKINIYVILSMLFCLLSSVSYLFNIKYSSFPRTIFMLFFLGVLVYQFASFNKFHFEITVFSVFVGSLLFYILYIIKYNTSLFNFSSFERLGMDFDNQNSIARCFVVVGLLSIYYLLKYKIYPLAIVSILSFYLCLTTGSISNLLCFLLCAFVLLLASFKKKGKLITTISFVLAIVVIIVIIQMPFAKYFKDRIVNIIYTLFGGNQGRVDASTYDRFILAIDAFNLFLDRPLFGYGYNSTHLYTSGTGLFSHNNLIELLSNFGFFAFLVYEFMIIYPLICMRKLKKKTGDIETIWPINVFLLIFQIFLVTFYLKIDCLLVPILFACLSKYDYMYVISFSNKHLLIKKVLPRKAIGIVNDYYEVAI